MKSKLLALFVLVTMPLSALANNGRLQSQSRDSIVADITISDARTESVASGESYSYRFSSSSSHMVAVYSGRGIFTELTRTESKKVQQGPADTVGYVTDRISYAGDRKVTMHSKYDLRPKNSGDGSFGHFRGDYQIPAEITRGTWDEYVAGRDIEILLDTKIVEARYNDLISQISSQLQSILRTTTAGDLRAQFGVYDMKGPHTCTINLQKKVCHSPYIHMRIVLDAYL